MPLYVATEALRSTHPALWGTPELTGLTQKWEFSYEFATFWLALKRGEFDNTNESHVRCWRIARRKSAYPTIIQDFGIFTDEGNELWRDIDVAFTRLIRWYQQNNKERPAWNEAREMHEIIPFGTFPTNMIYIMQRLYMDVAVEKRKYARVSLNPYIPVFDYITDDQGRKLILVRSIHSVRSARQAFEHMVKFGLVDLIDLPRFDHQKGRGRRPVAACLSDAGVRFYDNYAETADPLVIKELQWQREYQEDMAEQQE